MSEHTPGPWHIYSTAHATKSSCDVSIYAETKIHKNPKYLCRVYGEGSMTMYGMERRDANARLIAAAPEMLEALEDLVTCPAFNSKVFATDKESHRAWTLARAVLKKARGE